MRSDLIELKNIMYAKVTRAADMEKTLKAKKVILDPSVNSGNVISGQDYILRIAFRQYAGMSDEDMYFKHAMVHGYSNMSTSDFYKTLAISLAKNFSRESVKLLSFYLTSASGETEVTPTTKEDDLTGDYKGVVIKEVEQDWVLGVKPQVSVYFEVVPTTIIDDGDERVWGKVEEVASNVTIGNGKTIADLEYFCMGERGDIYRNIGWPYVMPTKYLVDPAQTYDVIDIHYAFVGSNEAVQKSEKDITLVVLPSETDTLVNALKGIVFPEDPETSDPETPESEEE